MLRSPLAFFALGLVLSGCGKPAPPPPRPVGGGRAPVSGGTGFHTGTGGSGTDVDPGKKTEGDGWIPAGIPGDQKDLDYCSVFHLSKIKGIVYVENLDRFIIFRSGGAGGTGSSLTASNIIEVVTSWDIAPGELMDKMKAGPEKMDVFCRLKGTRTMTKRFGPPIGMSGEKQEWMFTVQKEIWSMPETEYTHKMTILEEELFDDYVAAIEGNVAPMADKWKAHQAAADDLGWELADLLRDRTKAPFDAFVTALQRIRDCEAQVNAKTGDLIEAAAWLKLLMEWSHLPGSVVSGDQDLGRTKRADESRLAKVKTLEAQLRERLKPGGLRIAPEDAGKLLTATDGTIAQKFCIFAGEAGQTEVSMDVALAVFGSDEKADWKATTLSIVKGQVSADPKYFASWNDDTILKFPAKLKAAVMPFSKGNLIATRNAVAILEALKKGRPGVAFSPSIDDLIAELKKK